MLQRTRSICNARTSCQVLCLQCTYCTIEVSCKGGRCTLAGPCLFSAIFILFTTQRVARPCIQDCDHLERFYQSQLQHSSTIQKQLEVALADSLAQQEAVNMSFSDFYGYGAFCTITYHHLTTVGHKRANIDKPDAMPRLLSTEAKWSCMIEGLRAFHRQCESSGHFAHQHIALGCMN